MKLEISKIIKGNKKPEQQKNIIKHIKKLYESREKVLKFCDYYSSVVSEEKYKSKYGENLKALSPKQRLAIALAQVKASQTFENLLNEIRKIIYSLY